MLEDLKEKEEKKMDLDGQGRLTVSDDSSILGQKRGDNRAFDVTFKFVFLSHLRQNNLKALKLPPCIN